MKSDRIYRTNILGEDYVFRPLSIGEFRQVSLVEDSEEKELGILSRALVSPKVEKLDDLLSGVAECLIAAVSSVTDITEESLMRKVQEERDRLGVTDNILALELEVIRHLNYTPDRVRDMSIDEFVEAVVMAEVIAGKPLIASGGDDSTRASREAHEPAEESADPRNRAEMEDVARRSAERLIDKYRRGKEDRRGRGKPGIR